MSTLFSYIDKNKTGFVDAEDLLLFIRELDGGEKMSE
jgi:hypothetical protein